MRRFIIRLLGRIGLYSAGPKWLPDTTYPDDIYIVSYPKSGSTWLRFMLASYLTGEKCDFTNYSLVVPDIHQDPNLGETLNRPRFIKSHAVYMPQYPNVVYLVRDGRDVAVSYYFHAIKHRIIDKDTPFNVFFEMYNAKGIPDLGRWGDHVISWLDNAPDNFLLVTYENMRRNPRDELRRVLQFAGIFINEDLIELAIGAADFQRMKALEAKQQKYDIGLANTDPSIPFIRSGKIGDAEHYFDQGMISDFLSVHGQALTRMGYIE